MKTNAIGMILAVSASAHGILWIATWSFLRRAQRGWTKAVIARADTPTMGLALSLLGYAGWWLGSAGYAASPTAFPFRTLSPAFCFPRVGLGLLLFGHGLILWATLSLGPCFGLRPQIIAEHRLIQHGPYRFMRHPLYMGLHALYLGTFLLVPCGLFLLSLIVALIGNRQRARAEECALSARYGDAYQTYARFTGRFFPRVFRRSGVQGT